MFAQDPGNPSPHLFLSYAEVDREVAEDFCALLRNGCGVASDQIFMAGERGADETPDAFVRTIHTALTTAEASIHLLTPSYLQRPFCRDELGGAWAIGLHRTYILVPPATHADLDGVLQGIHVLTIDNEEDLDDISQSVRTWLDLKDHTVKWNREKRKFISRWKDLQRHVARVDDRPSRAWTPATEEDVSLGTFADGAENVFITSGVITRALHDLQSGGRLANEVPVMLLLPSPDVSLQPYDEDGVLSQADARTKLLEIVTTYTQLQAMMKRGAKIDLKFATFTPTATVFIADAWKPEGRLYFLPLLYKSYDYWRVAATVRPGDEPRPFNELCRRFGALWDDGTRHSADDLEPIIKRLNNKIKRLDRLVVSGTR